MARTEDDPSLDIEVKTENKREKNGNYHRRRGKPHSNRQRKTAFCRESVNARPRTNMTFIYSFELSPPAQAWKGLGMIQDVRVKTGRST